MNRVIIIGNLARDPELNQTASGLSLCRFSVAVNRRFTNAEGNREADFIPIIVWRNLAENCNKYLKKGSKVAVVGSIQTRTYDGNDGTKRYATEVVADDVEFLSSKSDSEIETVREPKTRKRVEELEEARDDDLPF